MPLSIRTAFLWHRWLGLASALLMLMIGVSGSVAVFKAEIDWLATPALRAPHTAAGPLPADRLVAALAAAYPGGQIASVELDPARGFAHRASVRPADAGRAREVFLDPQTAAVRGDREIGAGYFWSAHNFVRQFHVRLLLGAWGRVFVGVFGVILALSCLTGLYVYRGWLAGLWRLRWRGLNATARARELHKWVGVWSLAFNLLIAITGAVLGLENLTARIESEWLGRRAVATPPPRATAVGEPLSPAALVARAQAAFPDLRATSLALPRRDGDPAIVRGDAGTLIARSAHHVALDPVSGATLAVADRREARGWERVYLSFDPLHFGYFGGYGVKTLWFLLGLSPGVLGVTGFWLWRRRRARAPRPAAGILLSAPRHVRPISSSVAFAALLAALALAGRAHGWTEAGAILEHGLAKPLALALVAFPLTWAFLALARHWAARPAPFAVACTLGGTYYASLTTLFQ